MQKNLNDLDSRRIYGGEMAKYFKNNYNQYFKVNRMILWVNYWNNDGCISYKIFFNKVCWSSALKIW
jgi:hypothetical protein